MTDNTLNDEDQKAIELVQKLLNLAAKNPNPEEAASAASKAQKILAERNLEMSAVEEAAGIKSGKREKAKMAGGMYQYQRELWTAVAKLNFCMYWNQMVWVWGKVKRWDAWDQCYRTYEDHYKSWEHRVVGRVVNTTATKVLAQYLEQSIDRLLMEKLGEKHEKPNTQRWSSWAVAFREGAVDDIVIRLYERRDELIAEQKRRMDDAVARATEAANSGASTGREIALGDYEQTESDANQDFIMGEGWSARKRAERAEAARIRKEEEQRYTEWAAANPEEAAKEEEKRREERRKRESKRSRQSSYQATRASDKNYGAYIEGQAAGASISLDQQVNTREKTRMLK